MKKITSKIIFSLSLGVLSTPAMIALAEVTNFADLVNQVFINGILKPIVPFLIGLAVIVFIYGVIIFIFSEGGDKKEESKQYMFWGIVGMFVMVSLWGLVAIFQSTFQLNNTPKPIQMTVPTVTVLPGSN